MNKVKVKVLESLDIPVWLSEYKWANRAYLIKENENLSIVGKRVNIGISKIETFSEMNINNSFQVWVKLEFLDKNNNFKTIYLINHRFFGLNYLKRGNAPIVEIIR